MLYVRVDDFPGTKPEEFDKHNLHNFKLFDEVMQKHCPRGYLLGVIPKHVTYEQKKWLWQQRHITVAMHGVTHDEAFLNEFRPHLTEDDVFDRLYSGMVMVHRYKHEESSGCACCTMNMAPIDYIPPHNVIDHRTVRALKRLCFLNIYGGPGTDPSVAEYARNLGMNFYISKFPEEYGRSDELVQRGSVEHILRESKVRDVWLTLHWTWEHNIGLQHLDSYLEMLGEALR
jgi:hypothetical protein